MPIPTDTYWNIKRLNVVFAVSAVALLGVTGWAIVQDWGQPWREPQRQGKVWEAALVEEKIERELSADKQKRIDELKNQIEARQKELAPKQKEIDALRAQLRTFASEQADMEFRVNTLKANVGVDESQLQDAIAAGDRRKINALTAKLKEPQAKLAADMEKLAAKKNQVLETKKKLEAATADVDELNKQLAKMTSDREALQKKLEALDPNRIPSLLRRLEAKGSNILRDAPLMQFINPTEQVRFVELKDVLTEIPPKQVPAIDRCMTCHVNIANKDFALEKVIGYLEEQTATSRGYKLPEAPPGGSGAMATRAKPGATAMPEFWHLWGVKIAPELVKRPASAGRISALAKTVGKPATVSVDGKKLESFSYLPDAAKKEDAASAALAPDVRDAVVAELLKAWSRYGKADDGRAPEVVSRGQRVSVTIAANADFAVARTAALKYVEDLRAAMSAALPADAQKLLSERYRRAMLREVNGARRLEGYAKLDESPVMLAHPRMDLYVDVDSRHPIDAVGCTSCHDGSGQETNFVLAAHSPRSIWVDEKSGEPVLPAQLLPKAGLKAPFFSEHHGADLSSMLEAVYPQEDVVPAKVADIHLELDGEHRANHPTTARAENEIHVPEHPPVDSPRVPYIDPATGAIGRAVSQMKHWIEKYEPEAPRSFELVYHEWDWPMRPPQYLQANCARCHAEVNDIRQEAPKVFEGRSLFVNMGCVNCHQMDSVPAESLPEKPSDARLIVANGQRKVGTDLRNVTAKLSPAYINTWIWAPKAFRPSTKMPHFFMLENNSSDEELRRTRQEARAITEYLVRTANRDWQPKFAIPAGAKGSPEGGRAVFTSIGCQGCHTNSNDDTGEKRGGKAVSIAEKWIVTDLVKSGELARGMPGEAGKPVDAKALSSRAAELFDGMTYNERQVYITEHLAPEYSGVAPKYPDGTPKPIFQHHGPELSGVGTKLTAERTAEQARAWLYDWLKNPRHHSEYTVMPQLRLSDQQALDLTEYLLAQKRTVQRADDPWKAELTPLDTAKLIELTAQFLRSRYSAQTSVTKADDETELTTLAVEALTCGVNDGESAKTQAAKLSRDEKRLVFLGKKLISHYGCMSCHAINGAENLVSPCTDLTKWGQKSLSQFDFAYLDHHKVQELPATSKVPMVNGLSAQAALLSGAEWRANFPDGKVAKDVEVGWPHVEHSRSGWLSAKLKNTRVFDRGKVLLEPRGDDPGKPYDKLKMPTFYLSDAEVDAIVTWVIGNRGVKLEERLITSSMAARTSNDEAKRVARGRQLAQKYNCTGCHVVEGNAPSVQQYYKADEITTKAPPSLRGEGNKIQHTWLFNFLKNVEPLRPLLFNGIRMPSFPMLDEEATAIAAYFNSISVKESKNVGKTLAAVRKYIDTQQQIALKPVLATSQPTTLPAAMAKSMVDSLVAHAGALIATKEYQKAIEPLTQAQNIAAALKMSEPSGATTKQVSDRLNTAIADLKENKVPAAILWPGDDWYVRPEFATAVDGLRSWALNNKQISELQLDPTKNNAFELAKNHRTILFKAEFVAELYESPYPFVETPRPDVSEANFKKGEALFYEMQCLKCHVLGDPSQPGAQKNPTAPNLTLAHRRLQRRWVRHWVQEPAIIQIGTAMPPFFTGLSIFDVHGQAWPRSQGAPEADVKRIEATFGSNVEDQANLLLDFVYAAGVRGYTGVQPAVTATPPTPVVRERNPAAGVKPTEVEAPKDAPVKAPERGEEKAAEKPAEKLAKPQAAAPGGEASVKGVVMFEGKAPQMANINMAAVPECDKQHADPVAEQSVVVSEKNQLANVVISVTSGLPQQSYDPPAEPAVLAQRGCTYEPHVLAVMVGQKIVVRNDDPFLHNVHALPTENPPFNFGQLKDPGKAVDPLKTPERFKIKCDVHPWMGAWMVGFEHPFFAVSGESGEFAIRNLPPGEYTLTAWHEQLGTKEASVKVEAGKAAEVKFTFGP